MSQQYHVILSGEAELDIDAVFEWFVRENAQDAGTQWIKHLLDAIATLEQFPMRCPIVESGVYKNMHQLTFGKRRGQYLIHFMIKKKTVHILHIRHAARKRVEL